MVGVGFRRPGPGSTGLWGAVGLLTLGSWLLLAGAAGGDFRDSYRAGVEAIEAGRWADAIKALQQAIEERGTARVNLLRRYLPHYYLGVALAESNDCRGALAAWRVSEEQGEVKEAKDEYADLQRRRQRCEDALARLENASRNADTQLASARRAAEQAAELSRQQELAPSWQERFGALHDTAQGRLQQAERAVRNGRARGDVDLLEQASALAAEAGQLYQDVVGQARALRRSLQEAVASARQAAEEAERNLRGALGSIEDLKPFPPGLAAEAAAAEQLLSEARRTEDASPDEWTALERRLEVTRTRLERAARRPPRRLRAAVEAYLQGDYAQVLEQLEGRQYRDPRSVEHACLLRAAAAYGLYVRTGEISEGPEFTDAVERTTACLTAEEPPVPNERFYSPRFVDFYRITLAQLAEAAAASEDGEDGDGEDGDDEVAADEGSESEAMSESGEPARSGG